MKNSKQNKKSTFLYIFFFLFVLIILCSAFYLINNKNNSNLNNKNDLNFSKKDIIYNNRLIGREEGTHKGNIFTEILISSVGDCTLGTDPKFFGETMPVVLNNKNMDFSYLFKNVKPYFEKDDLTIANLETTFTKNNEKQIKAFNFKADPSYVKALTLGSIEAVNISNNHIYDFMQKGYEDTKETLENENISYFGEGTIYKTTIKDKKFAMLGYQGWEGSINFDKLKNLIKTLKSEDYTVIINFHWGIEREYYPIEFQKKLSYFCIDNGADLIIGHHPHVLQGIEIYKNKFICYSLGNFCFGGNTNPSDKDSMIVQTLFKFKNNNLIDIGLKVIPCSISSVKHKNDYCPTPLKGDENTRVLKKLNQISHKANFKISEEFYFIKQN